MIRISSIVLALYLGLFAVAVSEELTAAYQQELIDRYLYLRGEGPLPPSLEGKDIGHCGTQIAFEYFLNRDKFTGKYAELARALYGRYNLDNSIISPDGYFRIHYSISGGYQVYQYDLDTAGGGDGIPDYVNGIAKAADSAWNYEVNHLGFLRPPDDDTAGGDDLIDIYIIGLPGSLYGYTEPEYEVSPLRATSFIVIDNDYNIPPYNQSTAVQRRLDAANVTIAHEFFHTIHFGLDWTEYETHSFQQPDDVVRAWWEMTAVWMEETVFDNVDDYILYQRFFYDYPWMGLQAGRPFNIYHQYAAGIFPLYIAERFGASVIKDAWVRCRDYGQGPDWLEALNDAIISFSQTEGIYNSAFPDSIYNLRRAFQEFAVWNYFTGTREALAPDGFKFSEGANYRMVPDSAMLTFNEYDSNLIWPFWPPALGDGTPTAYMLGNMPQNLGAHYLNFENLSLVADSFFMAFYGIADVPWNLSLIAFPQGGGTPEILMFEQGELGRPIRFQIPNNLYRKIVAVPVAASTDLLDYNRAYESGYGYSAFFESDLVQSEDDFVFMSPYPNPIKVEDNEDNITFRAAFGTKEIAGKAARMEVVIFSVSGEKINEIYSDEGFGNYRDGEFVMTAWNLKNKAGEYVSAGIYLAYCSLIFQDGTPSVTDKCKVAIVR